MKIIVKILSFLILIVIFVCVIGVIFKFTGVGQDIEGLFAPFSVEFNGKRYLPTDDLPPSIVLPRGKEVRFDVSGMQGYSVVVTPNIPETGHYTYSVDGISLSLTAEINLTKVFVSAENVHSNYFTINALDSLYLKNVMSILYGGKEVVIDNWNISYLLTVRSGNERIQFAIW